MLRPLDYAEAYGAPGAGIVLSDIDRVLYDAEFANRMDGFGNGYTQRDEDIYVLLRDGTAYRHAWNFAFSRTPDCQKSIYMIFLLNAFSQDTQTNVLKVRS